MTTVKYNKDENKYYYDYSIEKANDSHNSRESRPDGKPSPNSIEQNDDVSHSRTDANGVHFFPHGGNCTICQAQNQSPEI